MMVTFPSCTHFCPVGKKLLAAGGYRMHFVPMGPDGIFAVDMDKTLQASEKSAFTLIELLVVIAIIGILMSLLFPAVNGATDAAKRTQAKNDVTQIATAVIAYETEYGKLPDTNAAAQDVSGNWLQALGGSNSGTNLNPRQIVFIELANAKKGKSGLSGGTYVDPWGAPYQIAFDDNYDNTIAIKVGDDKGITATGLRKKVAVWNKVTDMSNATDAQRKRRAVVSWE